MADPEPPAVLSLGSVNVDFVARIERRPEPGETLLAREFARAGGGKAANVAFMARRLGAEAELLARTGADDLSDVALAPLRGCGVGLGGVRPRAGRMTGVSLITVPPDGRKSIVLAPNANFEWEEEGAERVATAIGGAPAGSVLAADFEVPGEIVRRAILSARDRGLRILVDPSPTDRVDRDLLSGVDVLTPNAGEASRLTEGAVEDPRSALEAAQALARVGVRIVLAKLPAGGVVALESGHAMHVPPAEVEAVDTNGAGDAFAGAAATALLEERSTLEMASFAVAAASLAVTKRGAQASYPRRREVEALAAELASRASAVS